jgi:RNA polymerase-interacting CarD/CdnL/TRCF family regulator
VNTDPRQKGNHDMTATGDAVIAAALEWDAARRAWYRSAPAAETGAMADASRRLVTAVAAHREAIATEDAG